MEIKDIVTSVTKPGRKFTFTLLPKHFEESSESSEEDPSEEGNEEEPLEEENKEQPMEEENKEKPSKEPTEDDPSEEPQEELPEEDEDSDTVSDARCGPEPGCIHREHSPDPEESTSTCESKVGSKWRSV
ncbi:circumsporozoite protein-like [Cynara cardunculus var. scolymus]|uniref:circumsporozoite protein-like n=1 Tax=Cynara cardunculus var. scolymus TaxID=59895 RepID=UPI000D625353|nr:circumsporozoite protein-like [Cynara cardunculus var. scolymus]